MHLRQQCHTLKKNLNNCTATLHLQKVRRQQVLVTITGGKSISIKTQILMFSFIKKPMNSMSSILFTSDVHIPFLQQTKRMPFIKIVCWMCNNIINKSSVAQLLQMKEHLHTITTNQNYPCDASNDTMANL